MADSMDRMMTEKRINLYNPENRKHYRIRPRKTKRSKKGHIVSDRTVELFHDL